MSSDSFADRLSARASRASVAVTTAEFDQLEAYFRLLSRWNNTVNLTAIPLDPISDAGLDRLFVEPLAAAQHVADSPANWFDLGSGGGSPAIPLKIARPRLDLTMVESRERKAAFLREASRELGLAGVTVVTHRFEALATQPGFEQIASLVTARAVKVDTELLAIARQLLSPGGKLFLFGNHPGLVSERFHSVHAVQLLPEEPGGLMILTASG